MAFRMMVILLGLGCTVSDLFAAEFDVFLKQHCAECHGVTEPAAGLRLDVLAENLTDAANFEKWVRIHDKIAKQEMPPSDAEQPSESVRNQFLKTLSTRLHTVSLAKQEQTGRVLIRRLNRSEYEHTLHDLLGVATQVKSLLPEDNLVGGFDKVSRGLETSATHFVRYQAAADKALEDAFPTGIIIKEPLRLRWTGREFLDSRPIPNKPGTEPYVRFEGDTIIFCARPYKHGTITTPRVPVTGRYRVRASVQAVQSQGKSISVLMGRISSDRFAHDKVEHVLDIQDAPANQRRILDLTTILPEGEQVYLEGQDLIFFRDFNKERNNKPVTDDYKGPGLAVDWIELEGPLDAGQAYQTMYGSLPRVPNRFYEDAVAGKEIKTDWTKWHPNEFPKPHNRLRLMTTTPKEDAERFLRAFLPRAFRRPVAEDIVAGYVSNAHAKLDAGERLEDVLTETYKAILCSPHFLMMIEKPGLLDDYALASRLSYFLWDSLPDEELIALAEKGELNKPEVLRAQTERMLADWKSKRFLESFTGQWLDLRKFHDMKPDTIYVEYDEMLAWSMPEETRNFFAQVLDNDLPTSSFFHSDWTMLNSRMAQHYGIEGVEGMDFRRVKLPPASHRGGIITHASLLKLSTNATYTSPVKRGTWILERILGTPPSPPPPNVAAIEPDIRGAVTIRDQLQKHKSVKVCASCHSKIDPPGFALENFDVVGGWREFYRTKYGGNGNQYEPLPNYPDKKVWLSREVEAGGELSSGQTFANIDDYKQLMLNDKDQFTRNLAEKLLVYATGSTLQFADRKAIEEIVTATRKKNHGFRSLIHEVIQSRVFRTK